MFTCAYPRLPLQREIRTEHLELALAGRGPACWSRRSQYQERLDRRPNQTVPVRVLLANADRGTSPRAHGAEPVHRPSRHGLEPAVMAPERHSPSQGRPRPQTSAANATMPTPQWRFRQRKPPRTPKAPRATGEPRREEQLVHAAGAPRAPRPSPWSPTSSRSRGASLHILPRRLGESLQRCARPRLHRAERKLEPLGDLALRELAPVGELDQASLVFGQRLEGAVDANDCHVAPPARRGRPQRGQVERLRRRLACLRHRRDRVPRHRVHPRRAGAALGPVGAAPRARSRRTPPAPHPLRARGRGAGSARGRASRGEYRSWSSSNASPIALSIATRSFAVRVTGARASGREPRAPSANKAAPQIGGSVWSGSVTSA